MPQADRFSSFPAIGEHFGRDHSTVIHAYNLIARRISNDSAFRMSIEKIERELKAIQATPREGAVDGKSMGWAMMTTLCIAGGKPASYRQANRRLRDRRRAAVHLIDNFTQSQFPFVCETLSASLNKCTGTYYYLLIYFLERLILGVVRGGSRTMGIVVERHRCMNGLSLVQGIVERRNTVPILGHVLIEPEAQSIRLAATDLEVGISTQVPCKSGKEKSLTLNARKLFEIVRETEGEEFSINSLDNDWVELKCGRARFKMMGLDPRSFPAMPSQSTKADAPRKSVKAASDLSASVLAAMIDKTIFAVSPDEARYNLSGVYLEAHDAGMARMVATDGHRLSMIDREVPGFSMEGGTIIPRKGLTELRKLLDQGGDARSRTCSSMASSPRSSADRPKSRCAWSRANSPTIAA